MSHVNQNLTGTWPACSDCAAPQTTAVSNQGEQTQASLGDPGHGEIAVFFFLTDERRFCYSLSRFSGR